MLEVLKLAYQVRTANEDDIDAVSAIEARCFKDPYPRAFLSSLFALHGSTFLVAEVPGEQIVGYAVTAVRYGILGHLLSLATLSEYRRRGVASTLLHETIRILRVRAVQLMRLEVRASNDEAITLYDRMGFERGEREEDYYPDGEAALVMYKRL